MRRLLLILVAILATPLLANAQGGTTFVSGQVLDPVGNRYANSQVNISFYDPGTSGKLPLLNGSTFQTQYAYQTDSFGNLPNTVLIALPDNGVIGTSSGELNTQWIFTIIYQDRVTSFSTKLTINCSLNLPTTCSGNTINITAALQAVAAPLPGSIIPSSSNLSGPGTITGTFSGNPTMSGTWTFSNPIVGSTTGNTAPAANNAFTGNNTHSGTETFNAAIISTSPFALTNPGVFTNTQQNEYMQSLINGCSPLTEADGNGPTTDAIAGCIATPATAPVHQINAIAGYANSSCNSFTGTTCNTVAGYFANRAITNGAGIWGLNPIIVDTAGTSGTFMVGTEIDININGSPGHVFGLQITGTSGGAGVMPAGAAAITIDKIGSLSWPLGLNIGTGATGTSPAIAIGATSSASSSSSQNINFTSINSGGTSLTTGVKVDAFGNLLVSSTGEGSINANNAYLNGVVKNSANTATMGLTLKKGSGAGNYTNATTSYTVADATNLCYTVTIPTGWKLGVSASGALSTATAAVVAQAALTDNAACSTANAGILVETAPIQGAAIGVADAFALDWVITGDGAAHNIALQFKTSNAADTASLINSSATVTPTMKFELVPSN